MKSKHSSGLTASKAWVLVSVALSALARSNGQELYAFEMLEDEEAMPPYEIMPAENVTSYQVTSFQEVDANGTVTGVGVLAFTLYDIVYTQERLLCKEESCCEARNYSYEDIDLTGEEDYFPPCSINELVDILQQNCSVTPFSQTIPKEVFAKNVSTMCGYYTLYNQSNVSHALLDCVQDAFDQRWPGYCKENEQDLIASGLSFGSAFVFAGILLVSSTGKSLKGVYSESLGSQITYTILLSIFLAVAEYAVFFYSLLGQGYIVPSILREHHFSSKSISRVSDLPEALIMLFLNYFMMHLLISFSSSIEVENKFLRLARVIFSSIVNDIFYGFTFVSLRAISMFVLTMEFYVSQFGETDNQTLVLAGSYLMAVISVIKNLKELNFLRVLEYVSCNKGSHHGWFGSFNEKNDYLCHVYPKIQALFSSLLAPIVFGSFLSTFSSMTVTAGSNLTMQTLSYIAFITLNYCATIIGEDNHGFHLAHETIMSAMEAWAFMYTTNINMLTHEQFIDRAVYYDQYSNSPFVFAGLMCCVSLFCFYYQLSASQFIPELLKAGVRSVKKDRKRAVSAWKESFIPKDSQNAESEEEKEYACRSFDELRKHAQSVLLTSLESDPGRMRNLLAPAVREAFLSKRFYRYLCQQDFFETGVSYEGFGGSFEQHVDKTELYKHYVIYNVCQKSIDGGYAHPAVLQALAEVKNILLRMWHCNEEGALCAHYEDGEYDYGMYKPTVRGKDSSELDILFVGGHHFELIESGSLERSLMSGTKEFRRHLTHKGIQVDRMALNQEETRYFHQGFEGNAGNRRYELMITNNRSQEQKREDLSCLSEEEYAHIVFRTIAGGYFVDKLIGYFQNARPVGTEAHASHGQHAEPLKVVTVLSKVVTVEKVKTEKQVVDDPDDSDSSVSDDERMVFPFKEKELTIYVKLGEDFEEHSSLAIHGPTMLGIFLTLVLGSVPFIMNLNDAVNAVKGCLADLNASSPLNCSAECFNHYSAEIDVQDIGSSWLVLTCYLLLVYVVIKTYSLDRQKTQESRDHAEEHGEDKEKKTIKHQRLRLVSLLYYTAVALVSFAMGGVVLRQWKPGFDINESFHMNCSGDGPFRDTKRHLVVAANLCFAIGGVIGSVLFLHILFMSIREKGRCVSKVRCSGNQNARSNIHIAHDAIHRRGQSETDSLLANDGVTSSPSSHVNGLGGNSRLTNSSSQTGLEMKQFEEQVQVSSQPSSQHSVFSAKPSAVSAGTSPNSDQSLSSSRDDSIPRQPPKTSFLDAMSGSQVSSVSTSGNSDKNLLENDGLK